MKTRLNFNGGRNGIRQKWGFTQQSCKSETRFLAKIAKTRQEKRSAPLACLGDLGEKNA
jgi:hypothetical protein